jgi:hypothetical protein
MKSDALTGSGKGRSDNFFYLFGALVVLTVAAPVLEESLGDVGAFLAETSLSVTLVIALWSLQSSRPVFYSGLALVAVNILATAAWLLVNQETASIVSNVSGLAFLALTSIVAGRALFRPGPVDLNKILGALCVYVLIGVVWAILFQLLEGVQPGSFSGLEQQGHALSWRFLYFSFVTLTTLGYGDVLPLTLYAQSLTYLETVLGQFYLAVLVAALVSAYLADRERPSETEARERIGEG